MTVNYRYSRVECIRAAAAAVVARGIFIFQQRRPRRRLHAGTLGKRWRGRGEGRGRQTVDESPGLRNPRYPACTIARDIGCSYAAQIMPIKPRPPSCERTVHGKMMFTA